MKRIAIATALIASALSSDPLLADVSHLPDEVRAALARETFYVFAGVSAIPDSVRAAFAAAAGDEPFAMAEPGDEWQATDVADKALPRRRLDTVALSKSYCILFYELGGRGQSRHVSVLQFDEQKAKLVWRAARYANVRRPADILRGIERGALDDDPKNGF